MVRGAIFREYVFQAKLNQRDKELEKLKSFSKNWSTALKG